MGQEEKVAMEAESLKGIQQTRSSYMETKPDSVTEEKYAAFDFGTEWVLLGEASQIVLFFAWIPDYWAVSIFPLDQLGSHNIDDIYREEFPWGIPLQSLDRVDSILRDFDREPLVVRTEKLCGIVWDQSVRLGQTILQPNSSSRLLERFIKRFGQSSEEVFRPFSEN